MYCLRWWIPLFLLPFPLAPPSFLVLFIIAYVFHTRPCAYCGVIIVGLFISSCYWYLDLVPADAILVDGGATTNTSVGGSDGSAQVGLSSPAAAAAAALALSGNGTEELLAMGGATVVQQVAMLATGLLSSGVKTPLASWRGPSDKVSDRGAGSSSDDSGRLKQQDSVSEGLAGSPSQETPSSVWQTILNPLRRRRSESSSSAPDTHFAANSDLKKASADSFGADAAPTSPSKEGGNNLVEPTDLSTKFPYAADQQHLLARCPGSGRCWIDFSLMTSHGLFSPNPSYRLPQGGCRPIDVSTTASSSSSPSASKDDQTSDGSSSIIPQPSSVFPTLQELLEDAKRQVKEERAYQEDLQRKIEEEQAEVVQVVVAAEREEAAAAAAAANTESSSKTTTASGTSSKEDLKREERQSRARRIRSRSRKPAFRKADPEVDGEHTRGTYWIGVPGTAVGAFFDFTLR
ncbi:unnamed protein product [Tilletia controversa]|uniref:Uncharacterized protein n=2 Tax=Tilletia TaxID=13289 RepID=A0A177ULP6_9BASI|nr:hypothetical protein CF336_g1728 [Tilletia laevis]KAE8262883.1 hypothetical protein A4X03_0g2100 [Tilletia caries]CAD6898084.1 unnamed protein product [Tilletia controversa]KAE8206462.1 hypothetical protein CF335_g1867 [Tilletia laevis]CAD6886864.1 unnamed protein product [Tilletia caries]